MKRIQADVSAECKDTMTELKAEFGSYGGVIQRSVKMMNVLKQYTTNGELNIVKPDGSVVTILIL